MWTQKLKLQLFSALFVVLGVFGIGLLTTNGDSYAVSDLVFIIDNSSSNNTTSLSLCNNNCSDYDYLYIEVLDSSFLLSYNPFITITTSQFQGGSSFRPLANHQVLYTVPVDIISYSLNVNYSNIGSGSYKIVLTNNNPFATGIIPSGSLSITENGTYDVTNYVEAVVDVPISSGGIGDYSDDIAEVKKAIILIPATLLLIYFFYCIYRIIVGNLRR